MRHAFDIIFRINRRVVSIITLVCFIYTLYLSIDDNSKEISKHSLLGQTNTISLIDVFENRIQDKEAFIFLLDESETVLPNRLINRKKQLLDHIDEEKVDMSFPRALIWSYLSFLQSRPDFDKQNFHFAISTFSERLDFNLCGYDTCMGELEGYDLTNLAKCFLSKKKSLGNTTNLEIALSDYNTRFDRNGECHYSLSDFDKINIILISDFDDDSGKTNEGSITHTIEHLYTPVDTELFLIRLPVNTNTDVKSSRITNTLSAIYKGIDSNKSLSRKELKWEELVKDSALTKNFAKVFVSPKVLSDTIDLYYSTLNESSEIAMFNDGDKPLELEFDISRNAYEGGLRVSLQKYSANGVEINDPLDLEISNIGSKSIQLPIISPKEKIRLEIDSYKSTESIRGRMLIGLLSSSDMRRGTFVIELNRLDGDPLIKPLFSKKILAVILTSFLVIITVARWFCSERINILFKLKSKPFMKRSSFDRNLTRLKQELSLTKNTSSLKYSRDILLSFEKKLNKIINNTDIDDVRELRYKMKRVNELILVLEKRFPR